MMKEKGNKLIAFMTAFIFAFTGAFMFNGMDSVAYAAAGSASEDEETTYDAGGGVLGQLGIDTSQMPETYDPDDTDNPYGSDVTTMLEINELVKIDTSGAQPASAEGNTETGAGSTLYGHNGLLNGSYQALFDTEKTIKKDLSGPGEHAFLAGTDVDVTGNGRDEAAAIVYSNYQYDSDVSKVGDPKIYMMIYSPEKGSRTEPFELSSFIDNKVEDGYIAQSQMQITAGDFDNDTVEEIAVYVPAATETGLPRVAVYDLTNGTDCADPYQSSAWQNSWNYILPKCSGAVNCDPPHGHAGTDEYFIPNFYNNIDLTAGDADNDGSCDLIISYGASDVWEDAKDKRTIIHSLPSRSVLLYGSNGDSSHGGQMLRDSQELDYAGNELIRVSFAFGDLDGDGNEETILGGQLSSEQDSNSSRVLGKYIYDPDSDEMIPESVQSLDVVSGSWHEDPNTHKQVFSSSNGWDGYYYSIPAMKTNLAVGDILGDGSQTKIYLDSVLYSYDNSFSIVDELEDASPDDPNDPDKGTKGSAIFTGDMLDLKIPNVSDGGQVEYYEYGAFMANYTASEADYLAVHRVSDIRPGVAHLHPNQKIESVAAIVVPEESEDGIRLTKNGVKKTTKNYGHPDLGAPVALFKADTDIDSAVALYTGKHDIDYKDPRVLAVLASAPYFKDVADYDGGHMLDFCTTTYGKSSGSGNEYSSNLQINVGGYWNNVVSGGAGAMGSFHVIGAQINGQAGYQYTYSSGLAVSQQFEVTYGTAAGENEVAFFSTPTENYTYLVTSGMVDAEGNVSTAVQTQVQAVPHQPVTQTMPVDEYMKIQKRYPDKLPDVTKYLTSTPGDPKTYPSSQDDLPKAVGESWKDVMINEQGLGDLDPMYDEDDKLIEIKQHKATKDDYVMYQEDAWEGAGFGNGFITQTISKDVDSHHRSGHGGYFSLEIGAHGEFHQEEGAVVEYITDFGGHFSIGGDAGTTYSTTGGTSFSGTVANMPSSARGYGYDFSWSLLKYLVHDSKECVFPVITYMVDDVKTPPRLPGSVSQDFDNTTDSQIGLTWTYSEDAPAAFDLYRYLDFPQGGGDELVGSVGGSDYSIRKDPSGNTILDSNGKPIREYTFVEDGLTADTKYQYRMKVRRTSRPTESIFSPVIEARTDVSEKPDLSLSTDQLTVYPDEKSVLSVELADPEHYEKTINYLWQKYSTKDQKWQDLNNQTAGTMVFENNTSEAAGQYRCRVNLIRKKEGSPQYISTYTNVCKVELGIRDVTFGPITVFEGEGSPDIPTHTGLSVTVKNASSAGTAKPTGKVYFTLSGPNGDITVYSSIDTKTGLAKISSVEDLLSTISQQTLVNGGYVITARYDGDTIFNPAEDPEEYHYLRNIDECVWLQTESGYAFGKDIMPTAHLYDYKKQEDGSITRTEITDQIETVKIFAVDGNDAKAGEALASYTLSETDGMAKIPLNEKLKKKAWVEVTTGSTGTEDAPHQVIRTSPMKVSISMSGKISGCGQLLKLYSFEKDGDNDPDVVISGDGSLNEKNMIPADGGEAKSLADLMVFKYYQDNGEYLCSSADIDQDPEYKKQFIPARYKVALGAKDKDAKALYETFYSFRDPGKADLLVAGSYYEVTADAEDEATGSVRMISPILLDDINKVGFSGGSKITLKALPAEGFRIKEWKIEAEGRNPQYQRGGDLLIYTLPSDPTISSNGQIRITASFEPKNNTLTYETIGQGKLSVYPAFASGSPVLEGTQVQFTAQADPGWHFKEWRWENYGGTSSFSAGTAEASGVNSKTYTMGDTAAAAYAIFLRDTIDLDLKGDLTASYINNGENPLEETGREIATEKGRAVPKGTEVKVKTAPGFVLGQDTEWKVTVTTPEGSSQITPEEFTEGQSEGCKFTLPDDVTACSVETVTEKGRYSIGLEGEDVSYVVKLDDTEIPADKYDEKLQRIEAGTHVEIQAVPDRGKLFENWIVDGEKQKKTEQTYSFTLMDSVTVAAAVKDDIAHELKIKAEGGGTGVLTITDHNGKPHASHFSETEKTITVYEGESLQIIETPEDPAHIMTMVMMNGTRQDLVDGVFTLESVTEDLTFVCRFQPTTFSTVSFNKAVQSADLQILDDTGRVLSDGETLEVGTGGEVTFSVVAGKNAACHVTSDEGTLALIKTETGENTVTYQYQLKEISKNAVVTIDDQTEYTISNWEEFDAFMKRLNEINAAGSKERPQAVITADITMPEEASLTLCTGEFSGTLDGQGHTIKGLRLGAINATGTAYYHGEPALFNKIGSSGCVKNLIIEDFRAYYGFTYSDNVPAAMITMENRGTISGLVLRDCLLYSCMTYNGSDPEQPILAGLAVSNHGTVEACQIIGLQLYADRAETDLNTVGCAGVFNNESGGIMKGCYVEGLKLWNSFRKAYLDAAIDIITMGSGGTMQGNYYRVPASVSASSTNTGTNVLTITEIQDDRVKQEAELNKPAFAANLAWHMNKEAGPLWGVPQVLESSAAGNEGNDEMITPLIFPLDLQMEDVKAPVRAAFEVGTVKKNLYLYPDQYKLPGEESFGADTPAWWQSGDLAYAPDFGPIEISKDVTFTGVQNLTDCVAKLTVPETGTTCYKNLKDALTAAASCEAEGAKLDITADCSMDSGTFTVNENVTMTICDGAALTMKKSAQINNKGRLVSAEGSTLHKYGTIVNTGTIEVGGTLYNYGSKLKNTGTIENRKNIICKPHLMGAWQAADAPNEDGSWTKTSVCEICTNEITKKEDPNPAADEVESIEVYQYPARAEYVTSDAFSSDGLVIAANLKDGGKALVTGYELTISDEKTEARPIADGDILDSPGAKQITARYEGFECAFPIRVTSLITGVSIEAGGREVVKGETLQLKANVTPKDVPVKITWSSADESVATVDENGLVKGIAGGHTEITATVEGLSASCVIRVHEAAVRMELDQDMILVPKSGSGLIAARVTPATANGEVTWTLPDTSAAGFYVTDEQTGEVTLSKTITTKLSPGAGAESSAYVAVTGLMEGQTTVTAATADARGAMITRTCSVEVKRADAGLRLTYGDALVSGTTLNLDATEKEIQLEAESTEPDDTLQWFTVDDNIDPVIEVDDTGRVTLLRTGSAAVGVTSGKSGLTDFCVLRVETRPVSVILSGSSLQLAAGTVKMLTAQLDPKTADGTIVWSSSDETVAEVSDGVITGVRPGTAIVTAQSSEDPSVAASCKVRVLDTKITLKLSKTKFYYNGKGHSPAVTIYSGDTMLADKIKKSNEDVVLILTNGGVRPGTHTITATVKEDGMGTAAASFRILVKPTKIKKIIKGNKQFTIKWKKQSKHCVTGYQIRYSLKKSMKKSRKKTVSDYKKTALTVKKLKAKKIYYVQVRTYKKIGSRYYYSAWSKVKKVRTK